MQKPISIEIPTMSNYFCNKILQCLEKHTHDELISEGLSPDAVQPTFCLELGKKLDGSMRQHIRYMDIPLQEMKTTGESL